MCLQVLSICRYIGSLSKQHSRCLWHSGKVFILCRSLICSRSEPFKPKEQLLSAKGDIFLLTYLVTPLGNRYISVDLIFFSSSTLVQIQAPSPTLSSQICYLFYSQSINFYLDLIFFWLDLSFSFVFWIYTGNFSCAIGEKQCHFLNLFSSTRCHRLSLVGEKQCHRLKPVSSTWCHRLSHVIQKRCSSRTALSRPL